MKLPKFLSHLKNPLEFYEQSIVGERLHCDSYLWLVSLLLCTGGFVHGFLITQIANCTFTSSTFSSNEVDMVNFVDNSDWIVHISSALYVGEMIGALLSFPVCDAFGRRFTLLLTSLSTLLLLPWVSCTLTSPHIVAANVYSALGCIGVSLGASITVSMIYVAEIASYTQRGVCLATMPFITCLGSVIGSLLSLSWFSNNASGDSNNNMTQYQFVVIIIWRIIMFLCPAVLMSIQAITLLFIPETPRWLLAKKTPTDCSTSLQHYRRTLDVKKEFTEMYRALSSDARLGDNWVELLASKSIKLRLCLSAVMLSLTQSLGMHWVTLYGRPLFIALGFVQELEVESCILWMWLLSAAASYGTAMHLDNHHPTPSTGSSASTTTDNHAADHSCDHAGSDGGNTGYYRYACSLFDTKKVQWPVARGRRSHLLTGTLVMAMGWVCLLVVIQTDHYLNNGPVDNIYHSATKGIGFGNKTIPNNLDENRQLRFVRPMLKASPAVTWNIIDYDQDFTDDGHRKRNSNSTTSNTNNPTNNPTKNPTQKPNFYPTDYPTTNTPTYNPTGISTKNSTLKNSGNDGYTNHDASISNNSGPTMDTSVMTDKPLYLSSPYLRLSALASLFLFVIGYHLSVGSTACIYYTELFPYRARAKCVSVLTAWQRGLLWYQTQAVQSGLLWGLKPLYDIYRWYSTTHDRYIHDDNSIFNSEANTSTTNKYNNNYYKNLYYNASYYYTHNHPYRNMNNYHNASFITTLDTNSNTYDSEYCTWLYRVSFTPMLTSQSTFSAIIVFSLFVTVVLYFVLYYYFPETKGLMLEDMEALFRVDNRFYSYGCCPVFQNTTNNYSSSTSWYDNLLGMFNRLFATTSDTDMNISNNNNGYRAKPPPHWLWSLIYFPSSTSESAGHTINRKLKYNTSTTTTINSNNSSGNNNGIVNANSMFSPHNYSYQSIPQHFDDHTHITQQNQAHNSNNSNSNNHSHSSNNTNNNNNNSNHSISCLGERVVPAHIFARSATANYYTSHHHLSQSSSVNLKPPLVSFSNHSINNNNNNNNNSSTHNKNYGNNMFSSSSLFSPPPTTPNNTMNTAMHPNTVYTNIPINSNYNNQHNNHHNGNNTNAYYSNYGAIELTPHHNTTSKRSNHDFTTDYDHTNTNTTTKKKNHKINNNSNKGYYEEEDEDDYIIYEPSRLHKYSREMQETKFHHVRILPTVVPATASHINKHTRSNNQYSFSNMNNNNITTTMSEYNTPYTQTKHPSSFLSPVATTIHTNNSTNTNEQTNYSAYLHEKKQQQSTLLMVRENEDIDENSTEVTGNLFGGEDNYPANYQNNTSYYNTQNDDDSFFDDDDEEEDTYGDPEVHDFVSSSTMRK